MRVFRGFVLLLFLSMSPMTMAAQMNLYVINPPHPLHWKTPSSLSLSTALNSMGKDPAPIGHLFIELQCESPNHYGVSHVLTGMSRKNKKQSERIVIHDKIGMTSMLYDFEGTLDDALTAEQEIQFAQRKNRMREIQFQIPESTCQQSLEFIQFWIESESYEHYGGKFDPETGGGSGCAAFGTFFLKMAGFTLPDEQWVRTLYLPKTLMGDPLTHPVTSGRLIFNHLHWANSEEDGILFSTYDPELIFQWIDEQNEKKNQDQLSFDLSRQKFIPGLYSKEWLYSKAQPEQIKTVWEKMSLSAHSL